MNDGQHEDDESDDAKREEQELNTIENEMDECLGTNDQEELQLNSVESERMNF